jgi:hypothetical protein
MPGNIKRTAISASGYLYQTLVGIRLLCDWLDDPALYQWIQFEADDQADARGLDDIVAQRSDRLLDLIQVKFTVDPFDSANSLSWAWLLERKGTKGRSLLEKWSGAAFKVGFDRVGRVALMTNRRPDAEFALQLCGDKVDLSSLGIGRPSIRSGAQRTCDEGLDIARALAGSTTRLRGLAESSIRRGRAAPA